MFPQESEIIESLTCAMFQVKPENGHITRGVSQENEMNYIKKYQNKELHY